LTQGVYTLYTVNVKVDPRKGRKYDLSMAEKRRRRPLQGTEEMERVLTMLPKSIVEELDGAATKEGLSRSALVRTLVIRYLREQAEKA
jgi:hypothetical protein